MTYQNNICTPRSHLASIFFSAGGYQGRGNCGGRCRYCKQKNLYIEDIKENMGMYRQLINDTILIHNDISDQLILWEKHINNTRKLVFNQFHLRIE